MNVPDKTKGFTIIEVVLVLAIAGLIFLVVFLALPALQRGQRDNQRKQDLSRFMSQVTAYQSNNQGNLPDTEQGWNTFVGNYLRAGGASFADPQGSDYTVQLSSSATNNPTVSPNRIHVFAGGTSGFRCGSGGIVEGSGTRSFAALIRQEQGGYYCQNN